MNVPERRTLERIAARLREELPGRIASIYAFGSRVRGDHGGWSDFDVLVIVKNRTPELESRVIETFVEEEMAGGVSFTPVIKDSRSFELEERFHTPFYENVTAEGVLL